MPSQRSSFEEEYFAYSSWFRAYLKDVICKEMITPSPKDVYLRKQRNLFVVRKLNASICGNHIKQLLKF